MGLLGAWCNGAGSLVPGAQPGGGDGNPAGISHLPYLGLWLGVSAPRGAACSVLEARGSWGCWGRAPPGCRGPGSAVQSSLLPAIKL